MNPKKASGGTGLLNAKDILQNQLKIEYGAKCADLGCGGNGYFVFQAARLVGEQGLVYALDILKMVLKNIEHRAKMMSLDNIRTVWSNLENYGAAKINDASLDCALLISVLFQNKHPEKIFREAARMLKNGGKLLVIDWKPGRFAFGPLPEQKIKREEIEDVALGAGFKKERDLEVGKFHFGVLFEKI